MPRPIGSKTGQDYARAKQTLSRTAAQQQNNPLFQVVQDLVNGAVDFQGFVDNQFPQVDGSLSSLYDAVVGIINELQFVRNNSKFSVSLANESPQLVQSQTLTPVTFDTVIFDDGLMFDIDNNVTATDITLTANGQYFISITCEFGQEILT